MANQIYWQIHNLMKNSTHFALKISKLDIRGIR